MFMDDISGRLGLSMGSVSQGLKALKKIDVIEVGHSERERKDQFKAKTDFGRFLRCVLKNRIQPGVRMIGHSIDRIRCEALADLSLEQATVGRIDGVQEIYELLDSLVHVVKVELENHK
jgi:DNA-binding transcriptional regulator GbsR (MarR family)